MRSVLTISVLMLFLAYVSELNGQDCTGISSGYLIAEDSSRCTNEPTELTLLESNGSLIWQYSSSGTGVWLQLGASYNSDTIVSVVPSENMEYRVVVSNGVVNCDTSSVVLITVSTMSSIPETGVGETKCDTVFDPFAFNTTESVYYWSKISGPGNVQFLPDKTTADLTSMVVDEYGEYEIAWNISDGTCTKDSVITFTALKPPIANAGKDTSHCGLSMQLSAELSVNGSSGIWLGDVNFSDPTDPNTMASANPNSINGYELRWRESIGTYCEDTDTVIVKIAAQPSADAGLGGNSCDSSFSLQALSPILGAGEWELVSDTRIVEFDNAGLNATNVYVHEYGEDYNFQWKVINAYCEAVDTVTINFYQQPIANPFARGDECGNATTVSAAKSYGDGIWSFVSGPGAIEPTINSPTNPTSDVEIQQDQYGSYTFEWKEVNGTCKDSSEISFKFIEQPSADAGFGGDSCSQNFEVKANPSIGAGEWIVTDSAGSLQFLQGRSSAHSIVIADSFGQYQLVWKESNDICIDISTAITINFYEQPTANAGIDGDTCGFAYILNTVQSVDGSNGFWEGTANFTQQDPQQWIAEVDSEGDYVFIWTETNGSCFDTSLVYISFLEQPNALILSTDSVSCSLENVLFAEETNASGVWLVNSGPGELTISPDLNANEIKVMATAYGSYNLSWMLNNQICTDTDSITISFIESPEANAGPDQNLDNVFETTLEAALPSDFTGEWLLIGGEGIVSNPTSPVSSVYDLALGENMFSWTVANGDCINIDTVSINIFDIFIPDVITPNGDGDNDYFEIRGVENIEDVELTVFNRWGGEVYQSSSYQNDWDGTGKSGEYLTNDTYFYVVNIENGVRVFKGFVMINK